MLQTLWQLQMLCSIVASHRGSAGIELQVFVLCRVRKLSWQRGLIKSAKQGWQSEGHICDLHTEEEIMLVVLC